MLDKVIHLNDNCKIITTKVDNRVFICSYFKNTITDSPIIRIEELKESTCEPGFRSNSILNHIAIYPFFVATPTDSRFEDDETFKKYVLNRLYDMERDKECDY